MRRITTFILSVMLLVLLALPVSAATGATKAGVFATVSSDGKGQVTLTATLHLEQVTGSLTFPVPKDAYAVTLNGSKVRTQKTDTAQLIDLSHMAGKLVGDISITVSYSLNNVVTQTATGPVVKLPLLSGFAYPIEDFEFSVTLPGAISAKPAFSSGYHQANIEKDLTWQVNGPTVTGSALTELKDHETLEFSVTVPQEMFPRTTLLAPSFAFSYSAMTVCAVLALVYWLLTMRCLPPRRITQTAPPEGYSAGELGSVLTLQGANLTTMVFSWAQLGYVLIQVDRGKVLLRKRMDMGNERGSFERRCFQSLFRKGAVVDTSTRQYAMFYKKVSAQTPDLSSFVHKRSGNPMVFRVLTALIAMFCGICLGIALGAGAVLQWLLAIVLAALGFLSGWYMQKWAHHLFAMDRRPIRNTLILCLIWLLFGLLAGQFSIALLGCTSQLLAGLMTAFGGRRTPAGKQIMAQVLGLHRHLRKLSKSELQRISQSNPEYFHSVAPYALALGVDQVLARHMGRFLLPGSTYLTTGMNEQLTATEWCRLMRKAADRMEARVRSLPMERFMEIVRSFRR